MIFWVLMGLGWLQFVMAVFTHDVTRSINFLGANLFFIAALLFSEIRGLKR